MQRKSRTRLIRPIIITCLIVFISLGVATNTSAQSVGPLPSWNFAPDSDCGWHHNGAWREGEKAGAFWRLQADDAPSVRIPGGEMVLVGPPLDKPARVAPGDGIEMELRTSRTGWITLYYAEVIDAAKTNFGIERSERRLVYASPDFQTLRIRPRWRSGALVYQLRFDGPGFGGRLDIRAIRFFREANDTPALPGRVWEFQQRDMARAVLGNRPPPNLASSRDGIVVNGNDGPGMITLESSGVDADANPWIRIRMRTNTGPMGGIAFHPTNRSADPKMRQYWAGREFLKWFQFNVRADGTFHTYNVRLSDYDQVIAKGVRTKYHNRTGFNGVQRVFHIVPSHNPNAQSCVDSVSFGPAPAGPAFLVCEYAGAAQTVIRQGRAGKVAVRLRNSGGKPAVNIEVERADGNGSVTVDTSSIRQTARPLPPDSTRTLYLDVTATKPGKQQMTLNISCNGDQLTVPMTLDIEPSLLLKQGVIPEPRPIHTDYHIGCYYFTGWSDLTHWPKIPQLAERRPALGYYNELSPEAADWDIKWAVEHGIDHFVVLWYHHNGKQRTRFIEDALLKARFLPHIKFCVMWCNAANPWWKFSEQDFVDITDYWIRNYFPHKQYRRDDQGRPIAWMLQGWNMVQHFGKENAIRLMRDADRRARAAGFPGIHWIACQHGGKHLFDDPKELNAAGFQQWTAYNINGMSSYPYPIIPAETVVRSAPVIWQQIPVKRPVLPIFCGWNSQWVGRDFTYCYGFTPELFHTHLAQARAYLDQTDADSIIIDCWNEWGEGEVLGPNAEYGFRLLKEIPKVFAPDEPLRPIVVPEDVGITVPQIPGIDPFLMRSQHNGD